MKITDLVLKIEACPTLWECKLDGKPAYIRYRWGIISVRLNEGKALWNTVVAEERIGEDFDGVLDTDEMEDWVKKNGFEI